MRRDKREGMGGERLVVYSLRCMVYGIRHTVYYTVRSDNYMCPGQLLGEGRPVCKRKKGDDRRKEGDRVDQI